MSNRSAKARESALNRSSSQQNASKTDGNNPASGDNGQDGPGSSPATTVLSRTRGGAKRKTDYQSATAGAKRTKGYGFFNFIPLLTFSSFQRKQFRKVGCVRISGRASF
jgi:hypothetical protein